MRKKIFIIVILLLIVICACAYFTLNTPTKNTIEVGSAHFDIPEGYSVNKSQSNSVNTTLTNGSNVIHISSHDGKYATPFIKSYVNYTTKSGQSVSNSTLKINDLLVYRFENQDVKGVHEWFVYKNKVYEIYAWGDTPNFDGIAFELINSLN